MQKFDFKADRRDLYAPSTTIAEVVVLPMRFAMVDGAGNPNTAPAYATAVEALYATSYAAKFASKAVGRDYVVAPLEGLWFADRLEVFTERAKDDWSWTMMIRQPDWLTDGELDAALDTAAKKTDTAGVRFATLDEGLSVQVLHVGPYDAEGPVIARLHEHLRASGMAEAGHHHEVYLSDPRRVDPARLRTVLRQPTRRLHP